MTKFLQTLVDAVSVGSLYALIALGYTMVYGVLQFINFAHGDVFMLGAWFSYCVARAAGLAGEGGGVSHWAMGVPVPLVFLGFVMRSLSRAMSSRRSLSRGADFAVGALESASIAMICLAVAIMVFVFGTAAAHGLAGGGGGGGVRLVFAALAVLATAMIMCAIVGFAIERVAYRPLRFAPRLNVLITAIGVSLFIENFGQLPFAFGANPVSMPRLIPSAPITVAGVTIQSLDLIIIAVTAALMIGLQWLVFGTRTGLAMRAVAHDARIASLMGVPVDRVISMTFILGSALAAVAGFLHVAKYSVAQQPAHFSWVLLGLKAFVAAVVGGIGNIRGAIVGALLISIVERFPAAYIDGGSKYQDVVVFAALIAVLLVRPTGLFGRPVTEKV